ncbi:uncharacterized protein METZ01_LOCUS471919, partial [marine metagenome]
MKTSYRWVGLTCQRELQPVAVVSIQAPGKGRGCTNYLFAAPRRSVSMVPATVIGYPYHRLGNNTSHSRERPTMRLKH